MGFRDKMKKKKEDLQKRHTSVNKEGQRKYGSIFLLDKIPKGMGFWRPSVREHEIDIIPFIIGKQHPNQSLKPGVDVHFCVRLFVYTRVGSTENPFVSPYDNWNDPDPVREWMASQGRLPKAQFKKIASKERCVFFIWCHDTPEEEAKGLQIWEESAFNSFDKIQEQAKIPKSGGHIPFSDWDNGYRLFFTVSEGSYEDDEGKQQKGKQYGAFKFQKRPEGEEKIPDNLLDLAMANPLDELINMHPDYAVLYKAHHGKEYTGKVENPETEIPQTQTQTDDTPSRVSDEGDAAGEDTPDNQSHAHEANDNEVGENKCPHGHEYGKAEDFPECNGCDKWDACMAFEQQQMNEQEGGEQEQEEETSEKKIDKPKTDKKKPPRRPPRRSK